MEENTSFESQYAGVSLSENEQKMQKFLEETYGLTRDEFCSIVLWLDNFSLKFDNVERFESVENSLVKDFGLKSEDIFSILFSHGDVFCNDYSKTQNNFEFLNQRYNLSKKDFAEMLKTGCVIDKDQVKRIEFGLKNRYPDKKWMPMAKIIKNVIEYVNVDYPAEIAYKISLLEKFGVPFDDLNDKFGFLRLSIQDLTMRLKLMKMTNELPHSFLNVGYKTSNASVYKLFLRFQADYIFKKAGYGTDYINMKKRVEDVDETQPLTEEQIKYIDYKFSEKFKAIQSAISSLKVPEAKKEMQTKEPVLEFDPIVEPVVSEKKTAQKRTDEQVSSSSAPVVDAVESGKKFSYIKNSVPAQVKKANQTDDKGPIEFIQIDPAYKYIWTYMVKNFGLTYEEYPEVVERINTDRRNRLKEKASDIDAVFADISNDFQITRNDFGQFFKYTLYGMAQRLALLECFGITPQDLTKDNYANIPILGLGYDQLEYMLKVASIGNVKLEENLGRIAKYNKDTFLAKYIKFAETGGFESMLDVSMSEREYQDIIYQKEPFYKRDKIVENRYAEAFPVSSSVLEGYNENQRNLLMVVGFLIKKYGMSYVSAKKLVTESSQNFNEHTRIIQAKLDSLENLGFSPKQVIQNSGILRLPEEKSIPRATIAKYLGIDDESFLKHYVSTNEARVFARMMGAMDIKPSYYYASEKVFSGLTGLSTEELMEIHKITIGQLSKLKKEIYERESKKQMESVKESGSEQVQILDAEKKTPLEYTEDELKFRAYMRKNCGINSLEFDTARTQLGKQGLCFLNIAQLEQLLPILKREFSLFENEDIARLFRNNPKVFSSAFEQIVSRYSLFEENFNMTRNGYKNLLMYSDPSMVSRDDLIETFAQLKEMMQSEYGIDLKKFEFLKIIKYAKCGENNSIYTLVDNALKLLKNYGIDPSEIKSRFEFLMVEDMRTLETRLMLSHLMEETPNNYFNSGCMIQPAGVLERYLLYKQGKITRKDLWLRSGELERKTGIKIDPEMHISASKRIEVAKDFAKKVKNVSFGPTVEIFNKKIREKGDGEFVIRSNDYLTYMLAQVLGADYKIANSARNRGVKFADVYARFMGVDKFLTNPNKYYLPEGDWIKDGGLPTSELKEMFPIDEDTADIIKRAYFEKFPEDAFGIDGEFTKKLKNLGNSEKEKKSE